MTELEKHRKTWQGKSDEWLFERLALELKDKVETIHQLLAENEQLRIANVVGQSEQLLALAQYMCEHQNNLDGKTAKDYLQDFLSQ